MTTNFVPMSDTIKQQLFTQLCQRFDDAILILDDQLRYVFVNPAHELLVGYKLEFLLGRPLGVYRKEFLSDHERQLLESIKANLAEFGFYEGSFQMATRYGEMINCRLTFCKMMAENRPYYVGLVRDESATVKEKEALTHLINYNQLTGLPNRKVFLSQASELLIDSYQEVVIMRLNIDRYRVIASSIGAEFANQLIKKFAEKIGKLTLPTLYCLAHFGGDDFGLLFELSDANLARHSLDQIMQLCECPFVLGDHVIYLKVSIGVSYFPEDGSQVAELMTKAEQALHYVKQHGGDDVCWYKPSLNIQANQSLKLETEVRGAIISAQFIPYYQPKVELESGKITGFEALVRWQHPTRGLLKPAAFIDAISNHKLSFDLFCQMATQIANQLTVWQAMGLPQHICINADAAEFSQPNFFEVVKNLLDLRELCGHKLHIEVTESSLMLRHASVKNQLKALKELGICLSLDDFGTGYASLSYLQEYPFDFIKIDKSFISKIAIDPTQVAIVKAILDLAKALNMKAVAEGIETQAQRDLLVDIGCPFGQGYYFSKPVTAEKATQMLIDQQQKSK